MLDSKSHREPKPILGAGAPLLDRLVDNEPESREEALPLRVLEVDALRESVRRELARLLNTRRPHSEPLEDGGELTVLDYGIPDFSHLAAASPTDRQQLAAVLARAISAFEPRLRQVQVSLEPSPQAATQLFGRIVAILEVGSVKEPVSFPLAIGPEIGHAVFLDSI